MLPAREGALELGLGQSLGRTGEDWRGESVLQSLVVCFEEGLTTLLWI